MTFPLYCGRCRSCWKAPGGAECVAFSNRGGTWHDGPTPGSGFSGFIFYRSPHVYRIGFNTYVSLPHLFIHAQSFIHSFIQHGVKVVCTNFQTASTKSQLRHLVCYCPELNSVNLIFLTCNVEIMVVHMP